MGTMAETYGDDIGPFIDTTGLCFAEDQTTCDHGHITLMETDPLLGYLAEVIERNGIKRGGIQYDGRN